MSPPKRIVVPTGITGSGESVVKVKAILRVRPALAHESMRKAITVVGEESVKIANPRNSTEMLSFKFDHCYDADASQLRIFAQDVAPIIERTLQGYNATIFAYGNTGAGKTFTMEGTAACPGMIPLTVQYALESLKKTVNGKLKRPEVKISYLEIYKEKVYDLLAATMMDIPIREDAHHNILIPELISASVNSLSDFEALWARGVTNRRTAATKLNAHSSRSHSCLTMHISTGTTSLSSNTATTMAKLHLIDLAGSEDNRKTANEGERLVESGAINRSLFVLGQVVDALNAGASRIPYRDSKLTRLLQDSLGGRAYALIIANVAPTDFFLIETNNTLSFAAKTRRIENNVVLARDNIAVDGEDEELPIVHSRGGKRIKSSSPATMQSSADVGPKSKSATITTALNSKENNPFVGRDNSIQSMILERRIEEKVAEKLRQISKGTILSPLLRGEHPTTTNRSPLGGKAKGRSSKPSKVPKEKKTEEFRVESQVEQLLPLVEPELLRIFNYGTVKEIKEQINEIGAKRAQAIFDYRGEVGEIQRLSQLVNVGIVTNKVISKIIVANVIGHVDFVPLAHAHDNTTAEIKHDEHNGGAEVASTVGNTHRRINPLILHSEQDFCY